MNVKMWDEIFAHFIARYQNQFICSFAINAIVCVAYYLIADSFQCYEIYEEKPFMKIKKKFKKTSRKRDNETLIDNPIRIP